MTSKIIYLDSNDYSSMSEGEGSISEKNKELRDRLLKIKSYGLHTFVFSGIHISEMAPISESYSSLASQRTNLLESLCSRNCMISFDKLIKIELTSLTTNLPPEVLPLDKNGNWFPDLTEVITPAQAIINHKDLDHEFKSHNLSRKQRRYLKSQMLKGEKFRSDIESKMGELDLKQILSQYPMRPQDAKILKDFLLNKATTKQANEAFLESLRDPTWMMSWFANHYEKLTTISEWVRKPAKNLIENIKINLSDLNAISKNLTKEEEKTIKNKLRGKSWNETKDNELIKLINNIAPKIYPLAPPQTDALKIRKLCPGIATCLDTLLESFKISLNDNGRTPMNSDFVDALHSMYAPYVSYFRADRYMSNIISPIAARYDSKVFGTLRELVNFLENENT
ncbi:hypothetical protein [Pseudomonas soli]|uniref:hypothetical protein n=1 Tax=Pseudomonas soli TaxID=1306993 RepID=UPI003D00BE7F